MSALPLKTDMCGRKQHVYERTSRRLFNHLIGQLRAGKASAEQKQEIVKRLRTGPTSADKVDRWAPGTCGRPYNSQERSLCLRRVLVLRREP